MVEEEIKVAADGLLERLIEEFDSIFTEQAYHEPEIQDVSFVLASFGIIITYFS